MPTINIVQPLNNSVIDPQNLLQVQIKYTGRYQAQRTEVYLNGKYALTTTQDPLNFSFVPADITTLGDINTLSLTTYDVANNQAQTSTTLLLSVPTNSQVQ